MAYDEQSFLNGLAAGLSVTGGQLINGQIPPGSYGIMYSLRFGENENNGRPYPVQLNIEAEQSEGQIIFVDWGDGTTGKYSTPRNLYSGSFSLKLELYHGYANQAGDYNILLISNMAITPGESGRRTDAVEVHMRYNTANPINHTALYHVNLERSGATEIYPDSFSYQRGLKSVIPPKNLSVIGLDAFEECSSLRVFDIPESVTILDRAFIDSGLGLARIPSGVTSMVGAFAGSNLGTAIIADGVSNISDGAFQGCEHISVIYPESYAYGHGVSIPDSVTSIGFGAFQNCERLRSVAIPRFVTEIGSYAFAGCTVLTALYSCYDGKNCWPSNIPIISDFALAHCGTLYGKTYYMEIPDSVTKIGSHAFYYSRIKPSFIPVSVQSIGDCALQYETYKNSKGFYDRTMGFNGTKSQWITALGGSRMSDVAEDSFRIECTDGALYYKNDEMSEV